jgi:4-alpha-glucanotransferase
MTEYLGYEVREPNWTLIRMGMGSVAHTCVVPLQDLLGYGADTRMNTPGREAGNWGWRFTVDKFDDPAKDRLASMTRVYRRHPDQQHEIYGDAAQA